MSPPSCVPVFDVHSNRQDGQLGFQQWLNGKATAHAPTQHAAGSVHSSPLPSTSPTSPAVYSFDYLEWTALLKMDCSSNLYAGRCLDIPVSDLSFPSDSQDFELSSSSSSTPSSSMASPLGGDSSLYFASPDLLSHASSSPFDVGGQDLGPPICTYQDHVVAWHQPTDVSLPIPPGQHLTPPTFLPEEQITADVPSIARQSLQRTVANNLGDFPGNFISPPTSIETTALGLYYPDTAQSPDIPLVSTQADNNASVSCVFQHVPPPARPTENWKFRAVDPSPKASHSKRAQNDKARPCDAFATPSTATSCDAKAESFVECKQCGYLQVTKRMGDFRRHLKKHEAEHLSRVVCCGVPATHPAIASLLPGHRTRWYDGHPFFGGCGRSYSRMDALQRHLKKSGCIGGSAKDHQSWRKVYFLNKTRRPHKPAGSVSPSGSQNLHGPSPPKLPHLWHPPALSDK